MRKMLFLPTALTLDMTEQLAHSPRMLALFTTSILRNAKAWYFYTEKPPQPDCDCGN